VAVKLRGIDASGKPFEEQTFTENVSLSAFFCGCTAVLQRDAIVEVFLVGEGEQFVGKTRTVRSESTGTPYPRYVFRFIEKAGQWVLQ
jgi:hypothetical protein